MIGMAGKELCNALAIEGQLLFNGKEHLHKTQGQQTLGFDRWGAAGKFASSSEDLHASSSLIAAPQPTTV
jgi:hypothetical protein